MQAKRRPRKRFYIHTRMQGRILFGFTAIPLVSLIGLLLLVVYFCTQLTQEAMNADIELESVSPLFLSICLFVIVSSITTLYQALQHSNRIAGPIERITRTLLQIQAGDRRARLKLREGDYLSELAEHINKSLDSMAAGQPHARPEPEPETVGATQDDSPPAST